MSCYSINPVGGATNYSWDVGSEGTIVSGFGSTQICVEWEDVGGTTVSVTPSNQCFAGITRYATAFILPTTPTVLPPEAICAGALPITRNGNTFDSFGTFDVTLTNQLGCDSVVTYVFTPLTQAPTPMSKTICRGQGFTLGDSTYTSTTVTTVTLPTPQANGCDSIIELTLNVLDSIETVSYTHLTLPTTPYV